jgi:hypothetical protein
MIDKMALVSMCGQMLISMKGNGRMDTERAQVGALGASNMLICMKDSLKKDYSTVRGYLHTLMGLRIKELLIMVKDRVSESVCGQMVLII